MAKWVEPQEKFEKFIAARIDFGGPCWEWTGATDPRSGYGQVLRRLSSGGRRTATAHRWMYEVLVADVPADRVVDHLCRNRRCVNPDHLEPVSYRENIMRGALGIAGRPKKTHCLRGHPRTPENVATPSRNCKECMRTGAWRGQ